MLEWEMVRLGDVIKVCGGYAFKSVSFVKNETPIIRIGNLKGNNVELDYDVTCRIESIRSSDTFKINKDDILIAMSGATVGKIAKYNHKVPALLNQRVGKFIIDPNRILSNYLFEYTKSSLFDKQVKYLSAGCAQPNISSSQIESIKIPLPPIAIQQKIADILDKAGELIEKRKLQIEKLDLLVKAKFIDMFGDPVNNPMGWELLKLKEISIKITDGTHQSPKFIQKGIPFLFVSNIIDNKINYNTQKFINEDEYNQLIKRTPIEIGDILLTIVGSYGNPAIVFDERKFCFQRHIAYIKPNKEIINSIFLHSSFLNSFVRNQIEERVKGVAQKTLNLSELTQIKILVPPLPLQTQFATFVESVEAQKALLQQGLEKLEQNYQSLMQNCFNGTLFK